MLGLLHIGGNAPCAPPVNTVAPAIVSDPGGSSTQVNPLTQGAIATSDGTWTGDPVITFTYQWQQSVTGAVWVDVAGETTNTLTQADCAAIFANGFEFIRLRVTGHNACDESTASSNVLKLVAE